MKKTLVIIKIIEKFGPKIESSAMLSREYVHNSRPSLFDSDGNEINVTLASDKGKKVSAMSVCLLITDDLGTDLFRQLLQILHGF